MRKRPLPRRSLLDRPFLDLAIALIAVGLLAAAYVVADRPWPVGIAAPAEPPPSGLARVLPAWTPG